MVCITSMRIGVEVIEAAPVLEYAHTAPIEEWLEMQQAQVWGPLELGQHGRHGAGHAQPTQVMNSVDAHADVLPVLPAFPAEVAAETLLVVGIELKLVAELHEAYGDRAPGTSPSG